MRLEIAEYSVDWQTGAEQRTVLRVIEAGQPEAVFNIGEVTGIYEELVLSADERDSWFFRAGRGAIHLSDPRDVQFLVEPPALNVMQVRGEVFFYGSSERVVSIRHIPDPEDVGTETQGQSVFGGIDDEAYRHSLEQLGDVTLQGTTKFTIDDVFGVVTPRRNPEDFKALRDAAIEEHIEESDPLKS